MPFSKHIHSVLLKNVLVVLFAAPVSSAINFLTTLLIARTLTISAFGTYSLIFSIVTLFQVIIEASRAYLVKELAQNQTKIIEIVGETKTLLWGISILCFVTLSSLPLLPDYTKIELSVVLVAGAGAIALIHALGIGIVFISTEKMEINALGSVSHKILSLLLIYSYFQVHVSLIGVYIAVFISNLYLWLLYTTIFKKQYGKAHVTASVHKIARILRQILILGSTAIVRRFSWNVDVLLITSLLSTRDAGIYNASYTILFSMNMIPWIATLAVFPRLSKLAAESSEKIRKLTLRTILFFFLVCTPLVLGSLPYCHKLVLLLFGEKFQGSAELMSILWLDLLFSLPISFLFYFFVSMGKEKTYLLAITVGLATKVVLNLVLIQTMGTSGAAIGTLTADILIFTIILLTLFFQKERVCLAYNHSQKST